MKRCIARTCNEKKNGLRTFYRNGWSAISNGNVMHSLLIWKWSVLNSDQVVWNGSMTFGVRKKCATKFESFAFVKHRNILSPCPSTMKHLAASCESLQCVFVYSRKKMEMFAARSIANTDYNSFPMQSGNIIKYKLIVPYIYFWWYGPGLDDTEPSPHCLLIKMILQNNPLNHWVSSPSNVLWREYIQLKLNFNKVGYDLIV